MLVGGAVGGAGWGGMLRLPGEWRRRRRRRRRRDSPHPLRSLGLLGGGRGREEGGAARRRAAAGHAGTDTGTDSLKRGSGRAGRSTIRARAAAPGPDRGEENSPARSGGGGRLGADPSAFSPPPVPGACGAEGSARRRRGCSPSPGGRHEAELRAVFRALLERELGGSPPLGEQLVVGGEEGDFEAAGERPPEVDRSDEEHRCLGARHLQEGVRLALVHGVSVAYDD